MAKKTVFSGIQATGSLHLGNYLGAISNWVKMQEEYDNYFCVVDLHTITVPQDPEILKANIREVAGLLFAAGIDEKNSVVFIQSYVKGHSELAWIFNCVTPMGWLHRMTQFKEKSEKQKDEVSVGLFDYPVLQAADILLYDAHLVPVGEDQKQHVELCRDIAQRFNYRYGEVFVLPDALIPPVGGRVMGLLNPEKKMSKSEENLNDAIFLLDTPDEIGAKIKRATTDSQREICFDQNRPGVTNLLTIYELLTGKSRTEIEDHFSGKNYSVLKGELTEVVSESLRPLQERYRELTDEKGYLDEMLARGAEKAGEQAERKIRQVHEHLGLRK
ncbi:MAG: tryptophan--tRNA ligase [Bacillota bacterium]|nr:tryptophan--tRNA ligase [Bacillota bacterium]MDW7728865.1 tryptophan--tRNA ligase [Bacillota bacterium]